MSQVPEERLEQMARQFQKAFDSNNAQRVSKYIDDQVKRGDADMMLSVLARVDHPKADQFYDELRNSGGLSRGTAPASRELTMPDAISPDASAPRTSAASASPRTPVRQQSTGVGRAMVVLIALLAFGLGVGAGAGGVLLTMGEISLPIDSGEAALADQARADLISVCVIEVQAQTDVFEASLFEGLVTPEEIEAECRRQFDQELEFLMVSTDAELAACQERVTPLEDLEGFVDCLLEEGVQLIDEAEASQPSSLQLTSTWIVEQNSTTEAQIRATETAEASGG